MLRLCWSEFNFAGGEVMCFVRGGVSSNCVVDHTLLFFLVLRGLSVSVQSVALLPIQV